jgi:hypothetical protein
MFPMQLSILCQGGNNLSQDVHSLDEMVHCFISDLFYQGSDGEPNKQRFGTSLQDHLVHACENQESDEK